MGMSASQVRFLSLQSRKNRIGTQLTSLSNRKMALSRDMNKVSRTYNDALNQTVLKWSNDSGATYNALTYDLMMKPNDTNCTVPYIVTEATSGKVVLNSDELTDQNGNNLGISYIDIAKMISGYSGVDTNGNIEYNNTASYTDDNGVVRGNKAIDNAYYIPDSTKDFSFDNTLRYEIFKQLGLVSEEDTIKQKNLLVQLYGTADAEKDGVYPVGSAWGDYYIALANLEGYEEFLQNNQNLSTAGSYSGTRNTSANLNDSTDQYTYNAQVDGINGYSTITQTPTQSGVISHVDFSNVITSDVDGNYSYVSSNSVSNDYYDKYNSTTSMDNGITYTQSVDKNGMSTTYGIDDVYANALENYIDVNGTTSDEYKNYISVLQTSMTSGSTTSGQGLICLRDKKNDYEWNSEDTSACRSGLSSILSAYKNLMSSATVTSISEDALTKAANETIELYMSNINIVTNSADSSEGTPYDTAKTNAVGVNGISVGRKKFCLYPWKINRARTSIFVDSKPLFNTFMTYFNYFTRNPEKGSLQTVVASGGPATEDESTSSATTTTNILTVNNQKVCMSSYSNTDDGYTYTTRTGLLTSGSGDSIFVNSSNDYSETSKNGYTQYYFDSSNSETLQSKGGSAFTYTDAQGVDHSGVYGVVVTSDKTYLLNSSSAYNSFIAGTSIFSINDKTAVATNGSNATGYDKILYNDTEDNYSVSISKNASNSKYDITTLSTVTEDVAYHALLEQKVQEAKEHIQDLESDLSNLFGGADKKLMDYYDALFMRIAENGWVEDEKTASTNSGATSYLNNKLQNNDFFVTTCSEKSDETGYNYTAKMASTVTKIFEVNDDAAQQKALSKYESDKALISSKETKIDMQMTQLETEQEAISTEMTSVQKMIEENIEKTFKIFA